MATDPHSDAFSTLWEQAMQPLSIPVNDDGLDVQLHGTGADPAQLNQQLDPLGAESFYNPDGSVTIRFPGKAAAEPFAIASNHDANLALMLDPGDRGSLTEELIQDIEQDDRSREKWLIDRAKGIDLLALSIEGPRNELSSSGSGEGMSTVRNPLLLEAVLRFQAQARGELLPASGPVKVENGGGQEGIATDEQADALEDDLNVYLTKTATEYYPDTDKLLFSVGFGGCGFKKIFHCPIRRRPVSESVDAKDLIVNNTATDLQNAARITHRIVMKPSTMRRMQRLGVYRDVLLSQPTVKVNQVDEKIGAATGISPQASLVRPENQDHRLYECLCELDLPGFEDRDEEGYPTGIRLPYKVTIDVDSREILEIRRNWDEDDQDKKARRVYVKFPFVPGLGFYDLGLLNILGNAASALTMAWRICLDNGAFSNFPGFVYSKQGVGRQITNEFRVMPGTGVGIDIGGADIRTATMPLPYKELGPVFVQFIETVAQTMQRVGGTAETQVGEGRADAPVGTTLALIEQAKAIMDAVHKRLHAAQSEEFSLLRDRFKEDPDAFWRDNKSPAFPQDRDLLIQALENVEIRPVADPNVPSSMHRHAKIAALLQLVQQFPGAFDLPTILRMVLRDMRFDNPDELLNKQPPAPPPPDPKLQAAQIQAQSKLQTAQINSQDAAMQNRSRENLEMLRLAATQIVHPSSAALAGNPVLPPEFMTQQ